MVMASLAISLCELSRDPLGNKPESLSLVEEKRGRLTLVKKNGVSVSERSFSVWSCNHASDETFLLSAKSLVVDQATFSDVLENSSPLLIEPGVV